MKKFLARVLNAFTLDEKPSQRVPSIRVVNGQRHLRLVTDEGLTIHLPIPAVPLRAMAFLVDSAILAFVLWIWVKFQILLTDKIAFYADRVEYFAPISTLIVAFSYPLAFELWTRGRSIGALLMALDVVDERGEALRFDQIVIRRLSSYLEPILPAWVIFSLPIYDDSILAKGMLIGLVASAQSLHIFLTPGRQRFSERISHVVVTERVPAHIIYAQIPPTLTPGLALTPAQLDMYGSYELHTLEQCLRAESSGDPTLVARVAPVIRAKLAIPLGPWTDHELVLGVYNLLKRDLEAKHRMGALRLRKRRGQLSQRSHG